MYNAITKKGTEVIVYTTKDVEPNEGGLYCEINLANGDIPLDDFCIHPHDCDCSNDSAVEEYIKNYILSDEIDY